MICLSAEDMPGLQELYDRGNANGVKGLQILSREEVLAMEPNVTENVYAALYAPTAGNHVSRTIFSLPTKYGKGVLVTPTVHGNCPAIGEMVAEIVREKMGLEEKEDFKASRKGILDPDTLTKEERAELIRREPAYGNIICRCEMITEGEIIDEIRRPLGARSLDGVKRRTRAGMGRCQSGFCSPRTDSSPL